MRASVERQSHKTREARAVAEKKRESLPFLVSPHVSRLQSRTWSFSCLARFTRRTKKNKRLLKVFTVRLHIFVSRAFFSTNYKENDCSKSLQCVYTFSCLVRFARRTRKKKSLPVRLSFLQSWQVSVLPSKYVVSSDTDLWLL